MIICTLFFISLLQFSFSNESICSRSSFCDCGLELIENKQLNSLFDSINSCEFEGLIIKKDNIRLDCYTTNLTSDTQKGNGIQIENADNVTVENCNIDGFNNGINIINSTNTLLNNITATNNYGTGIRLENSNNNIIKNSKLSNNLWDGVFLINSNNNKISNNTIQYNTIDGIQIYYNSYNNWIKNNDLRFNYGHAIAPIVCNNTIVGTTNRGGDGKPVIYYENQEDLIIDENNEQYSEIILCDISDFKISNININNSKKEQGDGVLILHSNNGDIVKSIFDNTRTGIYLYNTTDIDIENNKFKNSEFGVRVYEASDNSKILTNDFINTQTPIDVINSSNLEVINALINNKNVDISINSKDAKIEIDKGIIKTQGDIILEKSDRTVGGIIKRNLFLIGTIILGLAAILLIVYLVFDYLKLREKYNR